MSSSVTLWQYMKLEYYNTASQFSKGKVLFHSDDVSTYLGGHKASRSWQLASQLTSAASTDWATIIKLKGSVRENIALKHTAYVADTILRILKFKDKYWISNYYYFLHVCIGNRSRYDTRAWYPNKSHVYQKIDKVSWPPNLYNGNPYTR